MTTFHIVPENKTGLENANTGDPAGDIQFALTTMRACGGRHQCMDQALLEAVIVTVDGEWREYKQCNPDPAQGGRYICCDGTGSAAEPPCRQTASCSVGREQKVNNGTKGKYGGWWYSFTACGEGTSWNVSGQPHRIQAKCLGDKWRDAAGGCSQCAGPALGECVRACVIAAVAVQELENIWYRVIVGGECPNAPPSPPDRAVLFGAPAA